MLEDASENAHDAGYDAEDEDDPSNRQEDSSDSGQEEGDGSWSTSLSRSVRHSVKSMSSFFSAWDLFSSEEPRAKRKIAKGVISAGASKAEAMDWEAVQDALRPALECSVAPRDGVGLEIAVELMERQGQSATREAAKQFDVMDADQENVAAGP